MKIILLQVIPNLLFQLYFYITMPNGISLHKITPGAFILFICVFYLKYLQI